MIRPQPRSTLFPYTTLFRSWWAMGSTTATSTATFPSSGSSRMAEQSVPKRGGGLQRFILWVVIAALFGTVWWLASDRNVHRFRAVARGTALVIERGRFFPTGPSPLPP